MASYRWPATPGARDSWSHEDDERRCAPGLAVREGWSLVRVRGAGLNRSELRTRRGHSPFVVFPRVLGIECVGELAASTDPRLAEGSTVAAVMGEMGQRSTVVTRNSRCCPTIC
ncbi:alcohol dehydrogenase catalytic domain-containing protein [Amycolatopsis methanolica]|uniref:alcohol dehydrogenase catalytic domain-containing protein n=1 Tax=Amycolatopsis methanolica TaxID=1814 RepID=UPI001CC24819|nr:alcohol dehydrogenase catalytic domain-containing protein [Amycolatopsis methanolica]